MMHEQNMMILNGVDIGISKIELNRSELLVIDNEAADVVRKIFHMYLLGKTKSEIADELNKREILTPALYKKNKGFRLYKN